MLNLSQNKEVSKEVAIKLINMYQGLDKIKVLNTMVKQGLITKTIAGQIIIEKAV